METLKKQILDRGEERSMFSPEASPANRSAWPDSGKDRKMTAISGRKCFAQYERYDQVGSLVRTLVESSAWYNPAVKLKWNIKPLYLKRLTRKRYSNKSTLSKPSAEILSKKDIPSSRLLFRLVPSVRRTEGTESSLLPTVQTQGLKICNKKGKTEFVNLNLLPTPTARSYKHGSKLEDGRTQRKLEQGWTMELNDLAVCGMLPTPTSSMVTYQDFVQAGFHSSKRPKYGLIPTPTTNDSQNNVLCPSQVNRGSLVGYIMKQGETGKTSQLNPLFVEEMMGFPLMWCVLPFLSQLGVPDQSKGTETQ